MNKIYFRTLLVMGCIIVLASCKHEAPKDYLTFSGSIKNRVSDSILLIKGRNIVKTIVTDTEGNFSDTLKVETGSFSLFTGNEYAALYLKNGHDLQMSLDAKAFDETISFTGEGAVPNTYLAKELLLSKELFDYNAMMEMEPEAFQAKLKSNMNALNDLLENTSELDTALISKERERMVRTEKDYQDLFEEKQTILALKGKPSPSFSDYENYKGGNAALEDFRGKYVYIDLWATWCGPCIAEIPALKEVEHDYREKNIAFLSISVDRKNAYDKWRTMVEEKELGGVQLWNKEDQTFMDSYKVMGIPRFILINPEGMVVEASAPRPSDTKLRELFDSLPL